jgi:hypothetical protein
MGRVALAVLVIFALSATVIYGQGQTDQSADSIDQSNSLLARLSWCGPESLSKCGFNEIANRNGLDMGVLSEKKQPVIGEKTYYQFFIGQPYDNYLAADSSQSPPTIGNGIIIVVIPESVTIDYQETKLYTAAGGPTGLRGWYEYKTPKSKQDECAVDVAEGFIGLLPIKESISWVFGFIFTLTDVLKDCHPPPGYSWLDEQLQSIDPNEVDLVTVPWLASDSNNAIDHCGVNLVLPLTFKKSERSKIKYYYQYTQNGKQMTYADEMIVEPSESGQPSEEPTKEDLHPPVLSDAKVVPDCGQENSDEFEFSVVYKDEDGDDPVEANVAIRGWAFDSTEYVFDKGDYNDMEYISGDSKQGAVYSFKRQLPEKGEYHYAFYFTNSKGITVRLPEQGFGDNYGLSGPIVGKECDTQIESDRIAPNQEISILIDDSHSHTYRQINRMNVEELNFSSQMLSEFPLNNLSNFDIILIDQPTRYYSNSEIEKIKEFVRNGGGLLVTNDWAFDSGKVTNAVNTITKIFEISAVEVNAGGGPYTKGNGTLRNHEINKGVESVHAGAVSRLEIPPSADILIQSNSSIIGVAMSYGFGRIVVLGDNDLIDRGYGYDNVKFFKNILLWLSQKTVSSDAISPNLVVNPGAETSDAVGWQHTKEFYATSFQSQASGTVYPHQGNNFFSMAPFEGSYGKAIQNISISEYASNIDNGIAEINAGAWIQNEYVGDNPDRCKMTIQYLDSKGNILKESTTGEKFHSEANYWQEINISEKIPINTRSLVYELEGYLHYGSWLNSYFDDAYIYITISDQRV